MADCLRTCGIVCVQISLSYYSPNELKAKEIWVWVWPWLILPLKWMKWSYESEVCIKSQCTCFSFLWSKLVKKWCGQYGSNIKLKAWSANENLFQVYSLNFYMASVHSPSWSYNVVPCQTVEGQSGDGGLWYTD